MSMTKLKTFEGSGFYTSPESVEMALLNEGAILSASTSTSVNASPEGYDVDDEVFNW